MDKSVYFNWLGKYRLSAYYVTDEEADSDLLSTCHQGCSAKDLWILKIIMKILALIHIIMYIAIIYKNILQYCWYKIIKQLDVNQQHIN